VTEERPRSQPETQDEADEARRRITAFWPEHVGHLSPEGNRLGSGSIVAKLGVVCNCGDVLGIPEEKDPEEYLAADKPEVLPDGRQLTPWGDYEDPDREITEEEAFAALASPNVPDDVADQATAALRERGPYAVGDTVTVAGMEFTKHSESPFPDHNTPPAEDWPLPADTVEEQRRLGVLPPAEGGPPWDTSNGPGPVKVGDDEYATRRAAMEARLAANPMDVEARAFIHGGMDSSGDPVRPEHDNPAEEHASRTETVVDLPPMSDEWSDRNLPVPEGDRNDMYAASPRGTLPVRPLTSGVIPQDPLSARVVTIDPSRPYSPADVELQLLEVENKLERGIHAQRYWEERAAAAAIEWEIIYNKARASVIGHGGSEKDRHALCLQNPEVELAFREMSGSSAMVRMMRESMHNLRSLQSGYQTLSRSVENSYRGRQPGA
jgi:hypothetical protein